MKRLRKDNERTCADGALSFKMATLMAVVFGVLALSLHASDPGWWSSRSAVLFSASTNNTGMVNIGELKLFTARAADELNVRLTNSGGAGPALSNLVYGWQQDYATNGYTTNTASPYYPHKSNDYGAANEGQIKYVASLLYGQLSADGYVGLYPSWIQVNTNTDSGAATLGQLKKVFNFDLSLAGPTNLTASANSGGTINLSWTLPSGNTATGYQIVQQNVDGTWRIVATLTNPSATSYSVTGLSTGENPAFQVIASTAHSNSIGAATPTDSGLVAPSNVNATPGPTAGEIDLTWQNNATDATYIVVRKSTDGITWSNVTTLNNATTTSYAVTNLTIGQSYFFGVAAGNN